MPIEMIDQKKKNVVEVLKVIQRTRAKGEDDQGLARIYEPGEEIRIKGSGKLSLLALGKATRDLEYEVKAETSKTNKSKTKKVAETKKEPAPKLNAMNNSELDEYAEVSLGINTKTLRTKPEKIAAIKVALKNANN